MSANTVSYAGGDAVYKQSEGADLDHPSHELYASTTTSKLSPPP